MSMIQEQIKQLRAATNASVMDCANALKSHDSDYDKALEYLRAINLQKADKKADRETADGLVVVKQAGDAVCAIELTCETDFVALTQNFKTLTHRIADQVLADPTLTNVDRILAADFIDTPGQPVALAIKELAGKLGENIVPGRMVRYQAVPNTLVEGYVHAGAIDGYGPQEGRLGILVELEAQASMIESDSLRALAHDLALQIASDKPRYITQDDIPAAELAEQHEMWAQALADNLKPDQIKARIVEGRLNKFYQQTCLLSQTYIKDESITVGDLLQKAAKQLGTPVKVIRFARIEVAESQP